MCGRYGYIPNKHDKELFELENFGDLRLDADYNISPTTLNPIITMNSPKKIQLAKWGLLPVWAKDEKVGYSTANARSEEVDIKPTWKHSFKSKRCLIPVSFYFEFAHSVEDPKAKIAYLFKLKDHETFALAGLYNEWTDPKTQSEILTYTIITTLANELGARVHSRMPVIIDHKDYDEWADNSHFDPVVLKHLLKPFSENKMETWPVSKEANNARNNNADIIKPVTESQIKPSKPAWEEKEEKENSK